MSASRETEMNWEETWAHARALLDGVTRRRMKGASSEVELALLDWGGEGDLVVLHHANGFCAASLAPIAKGLSDRFRVVSIDARGHGDSTSVSPGEGTDPYGWQTLAADLDSAIDALLSLTGHERVAFGIGHSFGGALFLRAASANPAKFERLLLCDPVILPPLTDEDRSRSNASALVAKTRERRDRFPSYEAAFEHCRSRALFSDFTPEALALYVGEGMRPTADGEITLKCDREIEAAIFGAGGTSAVVEGVEGVLADVVIVYAERSDFSREYFEEVASRMMRARVEGLDVGHLFPLEEPEHVLKLVDEWMENP
ncbi:MAG: alpha/beta hydrolase [bacterium]|nr:alpha/beta hydrolase [bacterium]